MTAAYVRQSRKNRETGTVVEVLDLCHPQTEFTAETEKVYDDAGHVTAERVVNRWMTVCTDHAIVCTHPTLALAESHAAVPSGWCEECGDLAAARAARGNQADGYDTTEPCPDCRALPGEPCHIDCSSRWTTS